MRAFFLVLFGSYEAVALRFFMILMSAATMVIFFIMGKRLLTSTGALLATLIWMLYPPQWIWGSRTEGNTFALNMAMICFYLTFCAWEKRHYLIGLVVGLLWASLSLTRGEYLLGILIPVAVGFFYFKNKRVALQMGLVIMLGVALGFLPWVIRNYRIHHRFILLATNYADNMWFSYNPLYQFEGNEILFPPRIREKLLENPGEFNRSQILKQEVINYLKENPGQVLTTIGGNMLHFWRPWLSFKKASVFQNVVYISSYIPLFLLFLYGIPHIKWKDPYWLVIIGFMIYKFSIHIPFYVIVRFRETIVPYMIIVATLGLLTFLNNRAVQNRV